MTTIVDVDELVGIQEATDILKMKRSAFSMARHRGGGPEPIAVISGSPLWTRSQIEEYAAERAAEHPS